MSNTPRLYRSTDPGAPQLSGQAGTFVAVLDAVLVDGYGGGADFKAPLGWTRAFSGTNKRAYHNDPVQYSGEFVRFDDSNAQFVLVDGYEVMSGIDAGSQRFHTASESWSKSNVASSAVREWIIVGTGKIFYVLIKTNGNQWLSFYAGDLNMLGANDNLCFGYGLSGASTGYSASGSYLFRSTSLASVRLARSSSNVPGEGALYAKGSLFSGHTTFGAAGFPYPLPTTDGLLLSRVFAQETGSATNLVNVPRATYPGVWAPEHGGLPEGEIFTDVTGLPPGTQLICLMTYSSGGGRVLFDLTNDW